MFHTKAMVIDGHISAIGSYNLDELFHKHNSEVMVSVVAFDWLANTPA